MAVFSVMSPKLSGDYRPSPSGPESVDHENRTLYKLNMLIEPCNHAVHLRLTDSELKQLEAGAPFVDGKLSDLMRESASVAARRINREAGN
jgi:hypothetical protein